MQYIIIIIILVQIVQLNKNVGWSKLTYLVILANIYSSHHEY